MTAPYKEQTQPGGAGSQGAHDWVAGDLDYNVSIEYCRGFGTSDNTPEQRVAGDVDEFLDAVIADVSRQKGEAYIAGACGCAPDDERHRDKPWVIGKPHRCKTCVRPRRFIGLDVDSRLTSESAAVLVELMQPYAGLGYTTASSTEGAPRMRFIVVTDRAVSRDELKVASAAFRAKIDRQMIERGYPPPGWDESCDRSEQPLFTPTIGAWHRKLHGDPLRVDSLLPTRAQILGNLPAQRTAEGVPLREPTRIARDRYATAALLDSLDNIAAADPGSRNEVANREGYALGGFIGAGRLDEHVVVSTLLDATVAAGWDNPGKTASTIHSAVASGKLQPRTDGVQDAVLFKMAPTSLAAANDAPILPTNLATALAQELTSFNDQDYALAAVPHPHVFGDGHSGIFPIGEVSVIAAPGREGKTYAVVHLACEAVLGRTVAGLPCTPSRVIVYSNEDDRRQYARKVMAQSTRLSKDDARRLQHALIVPNLEAPGLIDARQIVAISEKRRPVPAAMVDAVITAIRPMCDGDDPVRLMIFETASTLSDADEDNPGLKTLVAALKRIARELGVAVVLVHHTSQAAQENLPGLKLSVADIRGGTALAYNARQCFLLVNLGSEDDSFGEKDMRTHVRRHVAPLSALRMSALICLDTSKAADPPPIFLSWAKTEFGPTMFEEPSPSEIAGASWRKTRNAIIAKVLAERDKAKSGKSSADVSLCIEAVKKLHAEGKAPTVRAVSFALGHGADWAKSRLEAASNGGHVVRKRERVPNCADECDVYRPGPEGQVVGSDVPADGLRFSPNYQGSYSSDEAD